MHGLMHLRGQVQVEPGSQCPSKPEPLAPGELAVLELPKGSVGLAAASARRVYRFLVGDSPGDSSRISVSNLLGAVTDTLC